VVRGSTIHRHVQVLPGKCPICLTRYYTDHEMAAQDGDGESGQPNDDDDHKMAIQGDNKDGGQPNKKKWSKLYLNTAKYLRVGTRTWVDHSFSSMVLSGMYNLHASAAAFTESWNNTFCPEGSHFKMTHHIIWQLFIQESI
jgi:CxC5 like cysteine cluster associated with KDZ transposases